MTVHNADDVTNAPTGAVTGPSSPTTYHADDVDNLPAGSPVAAEPVVTEADWVPEAKVVEAPQDRGVSRRSRASKK